MVLIFIGVLLIACCKVLIGCTARSFLGTSNSTAHRGTTRAANAANMIYTINGQTVLANGQPIPVSLHPSSTQPPQLPRTTTGNPPNYNAFLVFLEKHLTFKHLTFPTLWKIAFFKTNYQSTLYLLYTSSSPTKARAKKATIPPTKLNSLFLKVLNLQPDL